jgi:glutathione S-transferase
VRAPRLNPEADLRRENAMKLYDGGRAPNPRRVRIFLAEKGIEVPLVPVDLGKMEHRSADFAAINPMRLTPALELDDGTIITESLAICRYFEELYPDPPLFGTGPLGRAMVEMWQRRLELELFMNVRAVFRHLHPGMASLEVPQVPQWGEANKPRVVEFLHILDLHLAGRAFVAGDAFSVADITGLVTIDMMKPAKLSVPEELAEVRRWHAAIAARPSARA